MSKQLDCSKQSGKTSSPKKRCPNTDLGCVSPLRKMAKVDESGESLPLDESGESLRLDACAQKDEDERIHVTAEEAATTPHIENELNEDAGETGDPRVAVTLNTPVSADTQLNTTELLEPNAQAPVNTATVGGEESRKECVPSTSQHQSDSAAIAAAEALASLTRGDGDGSSTERPCSSKQAEREKVGNNVKRGDRESNRGSSSKNTSKPERGPRTQAVAADSSTSLRHGADEDGRDEMPEADEDDDSIPGSSSTPSSSFPSDNEDDGECAIVSVKMAPEIRQSVALLAQVQMRLDALEKKGARLHQRLELKLSRQRRPHLDWRSSVAQAIPGFWVTALLNHPHLSAHIDENDEDALSYMTKLEIESFKNNKLGYRIAFHFRRNPYFQNNMIEKELHLGMGGSPVSFSNPILWHRGQNLTAHGEARARGVYQSFFSWFSDHSSPGRDEIAKILKDDLYRNPLRYYLTPLWEPRENGSSTSAPKVSDNGNRDECVVISDSDEEQEPDEAAKGPSRAGDEDDIDGNEDEGQIAGSEDSDQDSEEEESYMEKEEEEVDVEEVDESQRSSTVPEPQGEEDGEIKVDEEDES